MNQKEREILARYAHWKSLISGHGLNAPRTVQEFLEVGGCNTGGGCIGDSCSGGNGEGCVGDSCSAGSRRAKAHQEYIAGLKEQRQKSHLGPSVQK